MMFPEGAMWLDGSLYVAAPPSIWKLTDTDGDGVADQREEWFQGKTLTGCANDLHGPYLGPDGWIYWCKGAFAEQTYERPGKPPFVTRAAHIFRRRPDGDRHRAGDDRRHGQPGRRRLHARRRAASSRRRSSSTRRRQARRPDPRDLRRRLRQGRTTSSTSHPRTGRPDAGADAPRPGGAVRACTRYESARSAPDYEDNLFAAHVQPAEGHAARARCRAARPSRRRDADFVVSDNLDFHPTDVIEDADGSLLVVDTGGWYKLCCPTSQLAKPDVLGGIYRVRRTGAPRSPTRAA